MTPQTLILDRNFKGVGRIKKATGTTNPVIRRALSRMLTALHEAGRLDILRAIRDGQLAMLQVYDAYQRHALDALPLGATLKPLGATMRKWIEDTDASTKHRISLGTSLGYLTKLKASAIVNDLPEMLETLRKRLGAKHPRSFNLCRSAALAFVRSTLKRNHPLWSSIAAVEVRKVQSRTKRRPLSVEQMRGWFPHPETDAVDAIAWGMAVTGMGESEYWGEWSVEADRVRIYGTKRVGRVRVVPLVQAPTVPTIHPRTFTDKLRERTKRAIQPYDLRRTYMNWLASGGVPRIRRKLYMGHGVGDVSGLYELHEVEAFLKGDARKMRAMIARHTRKPTRLHLRLEAASDA